MVESKYNCQIVWNDFEAKLRTDLKELFLRFSSTKTKLLEGWLIECEKDERQNESLYRPGMLFHKYALHTALQRE